MDIRYYVDEDTIGLAKILAPLRHDLTFAGDPGGRGRPPSPVAAGTKDPAWLPVIGALGWLVVTRDRGLREKPAELAAIVQHGVKVATITSREKFAGLTGPFVYEITRTSSNKIA